MYSLENKVVVVTGASSGIGKALAKDALLRGARVAVCARSIDKLKKIFDHDDELVHIHEVDVSDNNDCKEFIEAVIEKWGGIDVLINNAGISMRALFEYTDVKVLEELMNINFWGTVYCTKHAVTSIKERKGTIVGVTSIAGYRGIPGRTGYSASKFAMQGFLESLRTELLHTGANVMWVAPNFTSSNIRNVARSADGSAQKETPLDEQKLMSAEECAQIILNAVESRKRTVIMTAQGKLTVWVNRLFAKLADKLVYKHFLKEPDSPLKGY